MSLFVERYGPLLSTLAITASGAFYLRTLPTDQANKVFGAFTSGGITVTTTLLGFLLTIYTIFQATTSGRKIVLIQLGHLPRINSYLRWAVWVLLVATITLLGITLIPAETRELKSSWRAIQITALGITSLALMLSVRFVYIFLHLIVNDDEASA